MQRTPLIAGNWKMNCTIAEAVVLSQGICNRFEKDWNEFVEVAVCPPYLDLKPVKTVFDFDKVKVAVGAQNVYWEPKGAYTGEVSVRMLLEAGCTYCIVGHSERRTLFGETNEEVNMKAAALIAGGLSPIICVGESLAVRESGDMLPYILSQVDAALAGFDAAGVRKCVIAYEPIWAIGTGRTATPLQAQEVCAAIRQFIGEHFGEKVADGLRILYGGSMNEGNAALLLEQPDIDGGLIGGASLEASSFVNLIKACL